MAVSFGAQALSPRILWEANTPATVMTFDAAAADSAGNLFVVGAEPTQLGSCIVTLKYAAASGAVLWRKTSCGVAVAQGHAIAVDRADNVVITGTVGLAGGRSDVKTIKYSGADGSILWERTFDLGAGTDFAETGTHAVFDSSNNVIIGAAGSPTSSVLLKYNGADGSIMWQTQGSILARVAIGADGNVFTAGRFNAPMGADWAVTKHSGSTGGILWRKSLGLEGKSAANYLALESDGSVVATGTVVVSGQNDMRTIKYAGADGAVLWDRVFATTAIDIGWAVAVDGRGGVIVTGQSNGDFKSIKYRSADGVTMWEASYADPRGFGDAAYSVAADASGDVYVLGTTGATNTLYADTDIRVIKYAASDGAQLWSSAYASRAEGYGQDVSSALVVTANAIYATGWTYTGAAYFVHVSKFGFDSAPGLNFQGLWWKAPAGSESGWGLNVEHQNDTLFATWFTYDDDGTPMWLVMSSGQNVANNLYIGDLYRTTGPVFSSAAFDPAQVTVTRVGGTSLDFTDANNAQFGYLVGSVLQSKGITRQLITAPVPECVVGGTQGATANYQGLWWASPAGSQSGWGLNVTHQGDILFITWFTYGPGGKGMWYVGSEIRKSGAGQYSGALYRTTGPSYRAAPWNPAQVAVVPVGSATLSFGAANNGTFAYVVDGVSQSKPITRQVFATPPTVCR
jgi:hypothetical protein